MAVWQPRRQAVAEPSALRRLLALLTFDSAGASPLAFGMRSAGGTVRQMLFSAEGHDIDLRIQAAGDAAPALWGFSGQVLGPQAQGLVSITDAQGQAAGASALDDLGEFRLPAVASGQYTLTLSLGEHEIVLPSIDVPQGA
jgi:hypothetical protein